MIPLRIGLRGFMSYRERQELCFDEDGLWVLEGKNGVGKSTIFDAITFALFGRARQGARHQSDLINHGSDSLEVELTLQLDGGTYRLKRVVPRKGRAAWDISRLAKDGRFVPETGTEQRSGYDAWVQEHLGLDYDAFTASVLLLQGDSEKLIRQDPADRFNLLAQLIDLSRYQRLNERAWARRQHYRSRAEALAGQIETLPEVSQEDLDAADVALKAAIEDRDALERAAEACGALVPLAEQRERLLRDQEALSRAASALADKEAQLLALRREEEAARGAEKAARQQEDALRTEEAETGQQDEILREERDRLKALCDRWSSTEGLRRQVTEWSAALRELPELAEEAAQVGLDAADRELGARRDALAHVRAEVGLLQRRLQDFERLAASLDAPDHVVPCDRCGQPITAAHAAQEQARLATELERFSAAVAAGEQAQAEAAQAARRARQAHDMARRRREQMQALEQAEQGLARALQGLTQEEAQAAAQRLAELAPALAGLAAQRTTRQRALKAAGEAIREARKQQDAVEQRRQRLEGELTASREAGPRLLEIARGLDAIPEAARRPAAELRRDLDDLKAKRTAATKRRDDLAGKRQDLEAAQRRRTDLGAQRAAAAREQRLYDLLAGLLGPEMLQRHLVREAEQAIVRIANQELADFTHGRLRLELRAGKEEGAEAKKALDLLVYNQETGEQPTALALASGSQKFRIAISLALAIGRYLARETRRVESVIIDEGFGCLDRASREDAVAMLRELGGHLPRVILVSHQEEFARCFSSGYRIDLIDQTSVPTRVSR